MQPLKLPEFDCRIEDNQIFCIVRKKWVALIPEEWVRQHFLNLLISHLGYPKGLTRVEHTISYFKNKKRSDIVILNQEGNVHLLVECKSSKIKINQNIMKQIAEYNKMLNAKYLAITNGLTHYIFEQKETDRFEQLANFPLYKAI